MFGSWVWITTYKHLDETDVHVLNTEVCVRLKKMMQNFKIYFKIISLHSVHNICNVRYKLIYLQPGPILGLHTSLNELILQKAKFLRKHRLHWENYKPRFY